MRGRLVFLLLALSLAPSSALAAVSKAQVRAPRAQEALGAYGYALVQLRRGAGAVFGGELLSPGLRIWRVRATTARVLRRARVTTAVEPDRVLRPADGGAAPQDPLLPGEWWRSAVGASSSDPPGPGVPVSLIDSGVDFSHPEFADRPDLSALNEQTTIGGDEFHGTAVASVLGAPANDVGLVGVYPQARIYSWDASFSGVVTTGSVIKGIAAAARRGPGVINLSLGTFRYNALLEQQIISAFGQGSLIVATAGNDFQQGSPRSFPANLNHVLTVSATGTTGRPSSFASASRGVDLAAPGESIPVAVPTWFSPTGYDNRDGTSFAAPIVSGAAAWVWTAREGLDNTQVFELMRRSADDVRPRGFDRRTGYGILDIPRALSIPAPPSDHQEPNDDISEVKANGLFKQATAPLTTRGRPSQTISARLDVSEDPEDVYRIWLPGHRRVSARVAGNRNVDVELWDATTTSVLAVRSVRKRHLLDSSYRPGRKPDVVVAVNRKRRGSFIYLDVFIRRGGPRAAVYTASVSTGRITP